MSSATDRVLAEVLRERGEQDVEWGEQNHPDGTGGGVRSKTDPQGNPWRLLAFQAQALCKAFAAEGVVTWLDILVEEVYEAFAESDPAKLREELLDVAAVAVAWVEAIDRRAASRGGLGV